MTGVPEAFSDIKIVRLVEEEVGKPRNDGTRGSALYSVPFDLSAEPPHEWGQIFVSSWDHPPQFSSMHRPGIARVTGDRIVLMRTTVEEVEQYHQETLLLALDETNRRYREYLKRRERARQAEEKQEEEHRRHISEVTKRIKF